MVANFPGPYGVEISYIVDGLTHTMELNCNVAGSVPEPGTPVVDITLLQRDGGTTQIDAAVTTLVGHIAVLYDDETVFTEYVLWHYSPDSFERTFITVGELNLLGTNANPPALAKYRKFTLRSENGGIGYLSLLECIVDGNSFTPYPSASAATKAVADDLTGESSVWMARDNGYFIYCPGVWDGQNEKTFRQRYRS